MDSSKIDISKSDLSKINKEITTALVNKSAVNAKNAIKVEDMELTCSLKLQYFLVEEFVRSDFIKVCEDGRIYLLHEKWEKEKRKVQFVYTSILVFPIILGIILLVL